MLSHFSCVQLFVMLWTVARQAPLSMGFSRQEYWSGLSCSPPGDFPDPRRLSPTLAGGFFTTSVTWETFWLSGTVLYFSKYLNFVFCCKTVNVVNIQNHTVGKRWSQNLNSGRLTHKYRLYAIHLFPEICYLQFYYLSRSLSSSLLIEARVCEITLF